MLPPHVDRSLLTQRQRMKKTHGEGPMLTGTKSWGILFFDECCWRKRAAATLPEEHTASFISKLLENKVGYWDSWGNTLKLVCRQVRIFRFIPLLFNWLLWNDLSSSFINSFLWIRYCRLARLATVLEDPTIPFTLLKELEHSICILKNLDATIFIVSPYSSMGLLDAVLEDLGEYNAISKIRHL